MDHTVRVFEAGVRQHLGDRPRDHPVAVQVPFFGVNFGQKITKISLKK
jgi:hypothetical protein